MRSKVTKSTDEIIKYPFLGEYIKTREDPFDGNFTVLLTSPSNGVVVATDNDLVRPIGQTGLSWTMTCFRPLPSGSTVLLTQE